MALSLKELVFGTGVGMEGLWEWFDLAGGYAA
jgi:hypothetical protein